MALIQASATSDAMRQLAELGGCARLTRLDVSRSLTCRERLRLERVRPCFATTATESHYQVLGKAIGDTRRTATHAA